LAPDFRRPWNIRRGIGPTGKTRKAIKKTAPRELEVNLVEHVSADGRRVLCNQSPVMRLLRRSAVPGVLSERLVLRVHLNAVHAVRGNHRAPECAVPPIR